MRRFAIAVLMLTLLVGVSVAEAQIAKGTFTGKTKADDPVGLSVDKQGRVYAFYAAGVTLNCTDGDKFTTPSGAKKRLQSPAKARYTVDAERKWTIQVRDDEFGNGWDVTGGKFSKSGAKSTGTLNVFANFDAQNQPDPNGSVHCETGPLKFSVKRKP
jgi:hypothetical protein